MINSLNLFRIGAVPRNEFRMARGGSSGDRARGTLRGRAFKKTPTDRDANSETSYYPTTRPKFQESLKNQENAQGKYYDDKRIYGLLILRPFKCSKRSICIKAKFFKITLLHCRRFQNF